jgi:ParB-like chromosome segregation protein Spo0J
MKKDKTVGGAVGVGGVNPAPVPDNETVRVAAEQLVMMPIDSLVPYANNARVHDARQINQIRASLREFGFVTPLLVDFDNNIIAGHGRLEAARAEGMKEVPCVLVTNLTEAQQRAYILADNRLSETAVWDTELLKIELEGLSALEFDTGIIGFEMADVERLEMGQQAQTADSQKGGAEEAPQEAEALDLDDAPEQERPRTCYHCPKCGFAFEVEG